jgi:type II secretory pathway component PulC
LSQPSDMAEMSERRDRAIAPLVSFAPVRKILDLLSARLESRRRALSRPLLALNLVMVGLSIFFCIRIGHALFAPAPRPTSPVARTVAAAGPRDHGAARNSPSSGVYDVIATKSLFDPKRSQSTSSEVMAPRLRPAPTLALHGVAISDDTRVAFVQDLVTKQLSGYKTGDKLAGGQVERIEPDRVVIMRADGPIEVLLRRPKEPQAVVPSPEEPSPRRSRGRQD